MADGGKKTFTLKNGTEIDGGIGQGIWRILQDLADREPEHFASLLALAEGRGGEVPAAHRAALRGHLLLRGDGRTVVEPVKNVLLSAAHLSPEGVVVVNPFRVPTEAAAQELEQARADQMADLRRLVRDDGDEPGRSPGRG